MKALKRIEQNTVVLLACFTFLLAASNMQAQQVRSDYQIQKDFKEELRSINQSLDSVETISGADLIVEQIKTVDEEYRENAELLNKALYPETFDEKMKELKTRAVSVQQRVATIEKQSEKLKELNDQLASYDTRLRSLNDRTDSLRNAMQKSVQSEKQLSDQVREYRESLERRDELILSIIDSVMIAYRNLDVDSMADTENTVKQARMNAEGNPLKLIQSIADENVQFLNSSPNLGAADYLRMKTVHNEFTTMWERVGNKVTEVYSDNPEEVKSNIDSAIGTWNEELNNGLWASIRASFEEAGVTLEEFDNSDGFAAALNNYVDQGLNSSREDGSAQARKNYQNFSEFWNNQVKPSWGEFLTEGEVLSTQQMASVDQKLDQWAGFAEPDSNTFVYLFGVSILAIVVLGVMLFRERSNHSKT